MNGDTDVLDEEILSCNNDRELDGKLDSNLNPRNYPTTHLSTTSNT